MKILFLIPPPLNGKPAAERIFGCNYGIYQQVNTFILYPATILKNSGYEVTCLDFLVIASGKRKFEKFCTEHDFDIIVFYTVFLSKNTDIIARQMLRRKRSNTKFIFMSTEPTASPDDFIDETSVVIRGEPESRILEVIRAIEKRRKLRGIPGISFKEDGINVHEKGCSIIDDLDSLPFPDRTLLNSRKYHNPKLNLQPSTTMITSRGCSFRCYYCIPNSLDFAREIEFKRDNKMTKPPVRLRSPQNIIAEVSLLAKAGYRSITFLDDQFVWGEDRTTQICDGISGFGIEWSCLARADTLQNKRVVSAMAGAGCKLVAIGIESFNQKILDDIGKGCSVDVFYPAVRNLKSAGIEVELNILLGASPYETKDTIDETFKEVLKLDPEYALFSICTPFPYTKFNVKAREKGWMVQPQYEPIDPMKESFISYSHLTKDELSGIIKKLYTRYYFRPGYIISKLKRLKGLGDLLRKSEAALTIFK